MPTAQGTFEVKLQPAPVDGSTGRQAVTRMLIDKTFHGDFVGTGQGEMLSAGNPASGSAAYVAIDHLAGRIGELEGSFSLQHAGLMDNGVSELRVRIVPGSGSGGLAGIRGELRIEIAAGVHRYTLDYTLG
ncbi:MAG: DUF3224 domain-containing protein [Gammaproteobacteria bacterium]